MVLLGHSSAIDQQTSSVDLGLHVSQLELGVLEGRQGLAELLAVLQVGDALVDGALSDTQSLSGNADTAAVQQHHGDLEAFAFLTSQSSKTSS